MQNLLQRIASPLQSWTKCLQRPHWSKLMTYKQQGTQFDLSMRSFSMLTSPFARTGMFGISAFTDTFLKPTTQMLVQTQGMKQKGKPKLRCKGCYFVVANERKFVYCKITGKHKQMSMIRKPKNTWILQHATQGKIRPW